MIDQFTERALAMQVTVTWSNGAAGFYSQPSAWSGGAVPNDGGSFFYNVIINRPGRRDGGPGGWERAGAGHEVL